MRLRWKLAQTFEILWWKEHVRGKNKQAYLGDKKAYWHDLLAKCAHVLTVKDTDSIIDMGCGPSGIYIVYPDNPITAVDPLIDKYESEVPVFAKADYPNVTFVRSAIEEYVPNRTYDHIFCMNAINHVSDIQAGFEKLGQLAHKGSNIIVTIDAHNNSLMKAIFRIGPGDVLHPHQYDKKEYTDFVANLGCEILDTICLKKESVFSHYVIVARKK